MRRSGQVTVMVFLPYLFGLLLTSQAHGLSEAYVSRAAEEVRNNLDSRGETVGELRFELARDPVVKPDCSELHLDVSSRDQNTEAAATLPDAFVHLNIYKGNAFMERATVIFLEQKPVIRFSSQKSPGSVFSEGSMDGTELQRVDEGLDPFFTAAVDVSRSSERFYPFLPLNIRSLLKHPDHKFRLSMPPGAVDPSWREILLKDAGSRNAEAGPLEGSDKWSKKLSDKDLRRFVVLTLDLAVQQNWVAFEGLAGDTGERLQPQLLVSKPKEYIKLLEKTVKQNRQLLEKAGVLAPRHLRQTSGYMKQVLGQSPIVKEVSRPEPCPCFLLPFSGERYISNQASVEVMNELPEGACLYLFGIAGLRLHVVDIDATPRIVCIALK